MASDYGGISGLKATKLIVRDIILFVLITGIAVVWIVFFVTIAIGGDDPETPEDESMTLEGKQTLLMVFLAVTAIDLILIYRRCRIWSNLVRFGQEVPATVTGLVPMGQGYLIRVEYTINGQEIINDRMVGGLIPRIGKMVDDGDKVRLLVDSRNTDRYIILDLFLKPGA